MKFLERGSSETEIREFTELYERVLKEYRDLLYLKYKEWPKTTEDEKVLGHEHYLGSGLGDICHYFT